MLCVNFKNTAKQNDKSERNFHRFGGFCRIFKNFPRVISRAEKSNHLSTPLIFA